MRISLKRFCENPYKEIKKTPVIIMIGPKAEYAIISYKDYKEWKTSAITSIPEPEFEPEIETKHWYDFLFH